MTPLPPNPSTPYYVIVGCGFSGILNHALLHHKSNPRLGGWTVLQIGNPDPWRNYYPMPMGQWPTLLDLPAYNNHPSNLPRCANLGSDEFADVNEQEWNALAVAHPFHHTPGRVVAIRTGSKNPYEFELDDGQVFQAPYIDVCGGPGPARTPPGSMNVDPVLLNEFHGITKGPGGWPRLLSGEAFLTQTTPASTPGIDICVYGGGPTGAWCVERAEKLGHKVYWISTEKLNSAFVPSRRNDGLLIGPVVRGLVNGEHVITGKLRPSNPSTFFGENLEAVSVKPNPTGAVELQFQPSASGTPLLTSTKGPLPFYLCVAQVVLSIGQETSHKDPRSWATLLKPVFQGAVHAGTQFITDRQRRVVGMQSHDKCVRLLGAAALSHPDVIAEWSKPKTPPNLFFRSLTEQSRVRNGITLSAVTIAEANGLWSGGINTNDNLNTAGLADLLHITKAWPMARDGAETWFEMRGNRIPPFELFEFQNLGTGKVTY